ncbi:lysylphosphatidylglycerol synthase domain-containing protein [Lutibacter sp. B1]|uniref:lysylphosphatidylglycerol synthase domain-containing protein n=1 Tax=Lutibacter sp. B1 TaxID=2725996 RepID=UPI001B39E3BA|nr:lysylphosphatidylglycerol synthase domain-containing protein [Lutibacter sp. B1]
MYNNIFYKYKHWITWAVKLAIVLTAIYFIYNKLHSNKLLSLSQFKEQLSALFSNNIWLILLLLLFTDANWFLEIFKWKALASTEKKITFFDAYEQSLASLTTAIITPNRIGEYGAKALYFKKEKRKKILALTFVGNISQLLTTTVFGIGGLTFLISNFNTPIFDYKESYVITILLLVFMYFLLKKWIVKLANYCKKIPSKTYLLTLVYSILRYIVFSHQFYFLLLLFNVDIEYTVAMPLIFSMYFIASAIPSLSIFDWAIKGSVALWVFSFANINELTIVTITTIMWLLNFAVPALLGILFVLNFKFSDSE